MASFTLIEVIDGHTLKVSPRWSWLEKSGDLVRIYGYKTPVGEHNDLAISKLNILLKDTGFDLKNPREIRHANPKGDVVTENESGGNMIVCSIYLNDIDIMQYFPEYKSEK